VTRLQARQLGFHCWQGQGYFLFANVSRLALGPTHPPTQWVPGVPSLGIKQPEHEADHLPLSHAKVKNAWRNTSTPQYVFMEWCLIEHRDTLPFYVPSMPRSANWSLLLKYVYLSQFTHACCKSCLINLAISGKKCKL
jgi:hypothetical protein